MLCLHMLKIYCRCAICEKKKSAVQISATFICECSNIWMRNAKRSMSLISTSIDVPT